VNPYVRETKKRRVFRFLYGHEDERARCTEKAESAKGWGFPIEILFLKKKKKKKGNHPFPVALSVTNTSLGSKQEAPCSFTTDVFSINVQIVQIALKEHLIISLINA